MCGPNIGALYPPHEAMKKTFPTKILSCNNSIGRKIREGGRSRWPAGMAMSGRWDTWTFPVVFETGERFKWRRIDIRNVSQPRPKCFSMRRWSYQTRQAYTALPIATPPIMTPKIIIMTSSKLVGSNIVLPIEG